jgi:hypothetical protein
MWIIDSGLAKNFALAERVRLRVRGHEYLESPQLAEPGIEYQQPWNRRPDYQHRLSQRHYGRLDSSWERAYRLGVRLKW